MIVESAGTDIFQGNMRDEKKKTRGEDTGNKTKNTGEKNHKKYWHTLRKKFIAVRAYLQTKSSKINNLTFHLKEKKIK